LLRGSATKKVVTFMVAIPTLLKWLRSPRLDQLSTPDAPGRPQGPAGLGASGHPPESIDR